MVPGFHGIDLVVILVIALLIFGPKRLPEMGSAIGKSIKEFRKGVSELTAPKDSKEEDLEPTTAAHSEVLDKELASKRAQLEALDREIASRHASSEQSTTETGANAE
jgi:sec-independent protein translocase protein TatA